MLVTDEWSNSRQKHYLSHWKKSKKTRCGCVSFSLLSLVARMPHAQSPAPMHHDSVPSKEIESAGKTAVVICVDGHPRVILGISDSLKPESAMTVQALHNAHVQVYIPSMHAVSAIKIGQSAAK